MRRYVLISLVLLAFMAAPVAHAQFLTDEDKARLQGELDALNAEIAEWQKVLDDTRAKKNSLQGDVSALTALINKATAEIKQRNLTISKLTDEIAIRSQKISALTAKLERGKASLAEMLRLKHQADQSSLAELVLSSEDFSSFFGDLDSLATVERSLSELFREIETVKAATEEEKAALAERQSEELDARHEVEVTQKQISVSKEEKNKLLTITKDAEKAYQGVLAERVRKAEQIRSALFPLRDVEGISFGDALDAAATASEKTGVRTALILAILSQESDLGKNVGSCYVTDLDTGDGAGKNTGKIFQKVMKAPRDTVPFERITSALGKLWGATPVSCPLGAVYTASRGYGGAMGPSQFIPSTWELYQARLKSTLGIGGTPDPWDAKTAITATALYLKDIGAAAQTYSAERNAACRYYSGRACSGSNAVYGDSVVKKADAFQENIDFLKGL